MLRGRSRLCFRRDIHFLAILQKFDAVHIDRTDGELRLDLNTFNYLMKPCSQIFYHIFFSALEAQAALTYESHLALQSIRR